VVETRTKDPARVRLGRLGALTVHARGRTNTVPAREAWEARLRESFGIGPDLEPNEIERRERAAMRVTMTRLAQARWGNRKAAAESQIPATATEDDDGPSLPDAA
jgi:hypothetical protein